MQLLGVRVKGPHDEWPMVDNVLTLITLLWLLGICYRLGADRLVEFFAYMAFTAVFIKLSKLICARVGVLVLTKEAAEKPRNIRKFGDQGWQFMIHVSMTVTELWILERIQWRWYYELNSDGPGGLWEPVDQRQDSVLNTFYLVQLSIWLTTAISHRFFEARHKDYFVMYTHHVATITLIAWSWSVGSLRIGFLVLLVHDSTDIMVDLLKLTNYAGLDERSGLYLVETSFVLNGITWAVGRLYIYPFKVVKSAHDNFPKLIGDRQYTEYDSHLWSLRGCLTLLAFLVILHCWWYFLILRMGYRLLKSERAHEVGSEEYEGTSSDSEAEEDETDSHRNTKSKKLIKKLEKQQ